jgi:hypothetical protein
LVGIPLEETIAVEGGPIVGIDTILTGKIDYYTLMTELDRNDMGRASERQRKQSVPTSGGEILAQYPQYGCEGEGEAEAGNNEEDAPEEQQVSLAQMLIL